ncbi:hypothetical protein [Flavobacterium wongokense]|uniref:hypothetical protein n=1 Tax=Flavobacterium wongokense TaxID=2910674 RepID=UPI001F3115AB|nr:hypothetical protein [Flavobacterium sp. WG47]MCF6130887.1 hypothetical protein [Flavobacterium sp. WG47]
MELLFSKINGTNPFLNYEDLKRSIHNELGNDCERAEVLILNHFPVPVLNPATLDLVIFVKVPNGARKPRIDTSEGFVYISNLIIAVSVVKEYKDTKIDIYEDQIEADGSYLDLQDNASKLKWGLTNYLHEACGLRENITVHPIFWVLNDEKKVAEHTIIAPSLTFDLIKKCISLNSYLKFPGYVDWNYDDYYEFSIHGIFETASLDSQLGYLTKQKIERFQNKFELASQKAFDEIGTQLVEVRGKPGSGKSSDLLKWMLQNSLTGRKATFLTYNHLLVFEISRQIIGFDTALSDGQRASKASTTANTIHSFMYNISKKLGVVLLMSEARITELKTKLDERFDRIKNIFRDIRAAKKISNRNELKNYFQNLPILDEGLKREAIDFINHSEMFKDFYDEAKTLHYIELFKKHKIAQLEENIHSSIFLSDYHEVLKNTLKAVQNLDLFFRDFQIENKFELLENSMNLKSSLKDGSGKIDLEELKKRYGKSIKGFHAGRTLYIDEAQDCHPYERDIFFSLFNPKNIVIASGGKEQLIRYSQVCDWSVSKGLKIESYQYIKRRKSYRMKPAIAALANHIAESFGIDLNVEPMESDDHGTIIIDKNYNADLEKKAKLINTLLKKGARQGCTSYDSILMLKNAKESGSGNIENSETIKNFKINEYDVIKLDGSKNKSEWGLVAIADKIINESRFWNATGNVDKKRQSVPGSLSIRAIYYESSRGLEAWATMCFDVNGFFDSKRNEDEADNFLLNEIMDPEFRKDKYAATWVIMALTRAIDTCYLELSNSNNLLMKSIESFVAKYPDYIEHA